MHPEAKAQRQQQHGQSNEGEPSPAEVHDTCVVKGVPNGRTSAAAVFINGSFAWPQEVAPAGALARTGV
jgi:hypothetical protein